MKKVEVGKVMKFLSVFLIISGSLIFLTAITSHNKYDSWLGLLALAMGILALKNYI